MVAMDARNAMTATLRESLCEMTEPRSNDTEETATVCDVIHEMAHKQHKKMSTAVVRPDESKEPRIEFPKSPMNISCVCAPLSFSHILT